MARKDVTDEMVCRAYALRSKREQYLELWPYDLLMDWTGECYKVCYRAMERAHDRGYIEYGVSLRSGWLSETGKQLIGRG
jgi:hypothetical protein